MNVFEQIEKARYQVEVLGNVILGLSIACEAHKNADLEERFHLKKLIVWIARRLRPFHQPQNIQRVIALPSDVSLVDMSTFDNPVEDGGLAKVSCILVDVDLSGEPFIAEFGVEDAPHLSTDLFPENCNAHFVQAIMDAELAVLKYFTERHRFEAGRSLMRKRKFFIRGPRAVDAFIKDGSSIGAAAAVVIYSLWTGELIPQNILLTGGISTNGDCVAVSSIEEKIKAALRERPLIQNVIIPHVVSTEKEEIISDSRVKSARNLEELFIFVFGEKSSFAAPSQTVNIEATLGKGIELYCRMSHFKAAGEMFQLALKAIQHRRVHESSPALFQVEEFICTWRLGSCRLHEGCLEEAEQFFRLAQELGETLWQAERLSPEAYLGFRGHWAVLLRDAYQFAAAEALLLEVLTIQKQLHQSKRERAKTLGNLGELWTFMGKFEEAERALNESLTYLKQTYHDEVPRALYYLGNLALKWEKPQAALELFQEGMDANQYVDEGQSVNAAFLGYGRVRALYSLKKYDEAILCADLLLPKLPRATPYPRQLIIKYQGLCELSLGNENRGKVTLLAAADLTNIQGSLLRFGVLTALAHLSLYVLLQKQKEEYPNVCLYLSGVVEAMLQVPGLSQKQGLAESIKNHLVVVSSKGCWEESFLRDVHEVIRLFLY